MRKFIIILCLFITANMSFASQYSSLLNKLENNIFGYTYTDSDETRLARLEKSIYGTSKSNKPMQERISALNKDMSADLIGQEISPKEDTFMEDESEIYDRITSQQKTPQVPPTGANVDYPSINELEKEVFNTENKNKDITERLSALEKKTFGQSYENDPFANRVERLQDKIKPKSLAKLQNDYDDVIPLDGSYQLDEYMPPDFDYGSYNARHTPPAKINLASVEKSIFKKSFNNDSMDNRLSRLESTMFGTTFEDDEQQQRINRIASAYQATKTANKYDSNKFTQNMAAATQIGMLILMILACVL